MSDLKVGQLIRTWRASRGIDQRELASEIGMAANSLCRLEAGQPVDMKNMLKVINWLFAS